MEAFLFTLKPELDAGDAISLITTLFLAYYIPYSINRIVDSEKQAKTFIYEETREIVQCVNLIRDSVLETLNTDEAIGVVRSERIRSTSHRIDELIGLVGMRLSLTMKNKNWTELTENLIEAWAEYTYLTTGDEMTPHLMVDNTFYLSLRSRQVDLEREVKKLQHVVNDL